MQATREVVTKLIERAMIPLNIGLGISGALVAMLATIVGLFRGEVARCRASSWDAKRKSGICFPDQNSGN